MNIRILLTINLVRLNESYTLYTCISIVIMADDKLFLLET